LQQQQKLKEEEMEKGERGVDYQVITDGFTKGY
jgi:hypothetical protein